MNHVVRGAGLEPAQYCYRQDLNLVRLPISPPARIFLKEQRAVLREDHPFEIGQPGILSV